MKLICRRQADCFQVSYFVANSCLSRRQRRNCSTQRLADGASCQSRDVAEPHACQKFDEKDQEQHAQGATR